MAPYEDGGVDHAAQQGTQATSRAGSEILLGRAGILPQREIERVWFGTPPEKRIAARMSSPMMLKKLMDAKPKSVSAYASTGQKSSPMMATIMSLQ